jgi:holo-[acyl-carrier protein] synthase
MNQANIGIDIIEIERVQNAVNRWGARFLRRIYTEKELELCRGKAESLAVRFAGKEAVMKALTISLTSATWKEIEILSGLEGEPVVHLHGQALLTLRQLGLTGLAISLSHSRENAIALVIGGGED